MGQVLSQILAGQDKLAKVTISTLASRFPNSLEYFLAEGFYQENDNNFAAAENIYAKGLTYFPDNNELIRAHIFALKNMGAISIAKKEMAKYPKLFSEEDKQSLDYAGLINRVRWLDVGTLTFIDNIEERQQLIKDMQARLVETPNDKTLKYDLVVAYTKVNQPQQAIGLYQELTLTGEELPDYVKLSAARAYLDNQLPEASIALFKDVYQNQKIPTGDKLYLYYAYSDLRDFATAETLLAEMIAENPPVLAAKTPVAKINDERIHLEALEVGLAVSQDNLVKAHDKSKTLIDDAPANITLRNTHAAVQSARGWHEQAEQTYEISHNLDEDNIDTLLGMIGNEMNLGQYEKAESKLKLLLKIQPDNPRVQKTKKDWERRTGWSVSSSTYYSESKDSVFGSNEFTSSTRITGSLINDTWRPIFGYDYDSAKLDNKYEHYDRIFAGIQYEKDKNIVGLSVGESRGDDLNLGVDYGRRLNDNWRIGSGYELNTLVPLKAIRDGVSGDKAYVNALYRADERWEVYANSNYYHYDDGNDRYELGVGGRRQVFNRPDFKIDAIGGIGLSKNKEIDSASYYNPKESASFDMGLSSKWLTYARYDFRFEQELSLGGGMSYQKYYGSDPIAQVRYAHNWQLSDDFSLSYSVDWKTRVYDGDRENPFGFSLDFNWYLH